MLNRTGTWYFDFTSLMPLQSTYYWSYVKKRRRIRLKIWGKLEDMFWKSCNYEIKVKLEDTLRKEFGALRESST